MIAAAATVIAGVVVTVVYALVLTELAALWCRYVGEDM